MNILLTGATGFLGSRVAALLKESMKPDDRLILLVSREIDGYECINHRQYRYDVSAFSEIGVDRIDVLVHIGWFCAKCNDDIADVGKNFSSLVNTVYLLSHLPNIPEMVIFISSGGVYGGTGTFDKYEKGEMITEATPIDLANQYAMSKYATELLIKDWAKERGVLCHILRPGPIYGVGDLRKDYLIGRLLYNAAAGENLSIYADPSMRRNYIYVDDCARFVINSIALKEDVGPINLVSKRNPAMVEIAETVCNASDGKVKYALVPAENVTGKDLIYSAEKCNRYLGKEQVSLEEGLKVALQWNKKYYFDTDL